MFNDTSMQGLLKIYGGIFCFFLIIKTTTAQTVYQDTTVRSAPISNTIRGNTAEFSADMPPLIQISGAPEAYYSYYWEFGDGEFSFEEKPKHTYKKEGEYTISLWSTNNYDNGKPPTSRPETIQIDKDFEAASNGDDLSQKPSLNFPKEENFIIKTNRDPLPDEDMVLITSYKNTKSYVTNGELYLFYNDIKFKADNFTLEDTRLYHGEIIDKDEFFAVYNPEKNDSEFHLASLNTSPIKPKRFHFQDSLNLPLPMQIEESNALYRNSQKIKFEDMQPGEERHIFRTLKTTPEMIKDTSAIISIRSIYVPDKNYSDYNVKDTEMEIVTSHDPNKMSSNGTFMSYRFSNSKNLKFKVKFQNDGEGPANTIRLQIDTPDMFDRNTLEITDTYPQVPICNHSNSTISCIDTTSTEDKLIFTFKNIYLPGSNQKNVMDRDSTKGFVKYRMKYTKKHYKKKTRSRTAIYFDKNEPVYTNYSATRFSPGISIGAKAGYIYTPKYDKSREFFIGATVSPYKSYKSYLQSEIYLSLATFENLKNYKILEEPGAMETIMHKQELNEKTKNMTAYLVPISYHYNATDFMAFETGIQLQTDINTKTDKSGSTQDFYYFEEGDRIIEKAATEKRTIDESGEQKHFKNFNYGVFAGLNLGQVRIGPSLGVRYVYNFKEPHSQLQAYAIWKF